MTKMKRRAESVPVPIDVTEANGFLHLLGMANRELALIDAAKAESVALAAQVAADAARPHAEHAAQLARGLQIWAEANRAMLTNGGKRKTVHMPSGTIGWRKAPPSVKLTKVEAVIEAVRTLGLVQFLRTKTEVNREAMLAEPALAATVAGVTVSSDGEELFIEPVVPKGAAA